MITILVDDLRSFADGRDATVCRTPGAALDVLEGYRGTITCFGDDVEIDELWLDHDMGPGVTIEPVMDWLVKQQFASDLRTDWIKKIWVHTSNPPAGDRMVAALKDAGYNVERFWGSWLNEPMWKYIPVKEEM